MQKPATKCLFPLRVSRFLQNRKPTYLNVKKSAYLAQSEEVFDLNGMSWFPGKFYPRNSQKHESELATFDQPIKLKHFGD
jgi:hypothetical protein